MGNPGMGVMLGYLGGNEKTVDTVKASIGKHITKIEIKDNELHLTFEGEGEGIVIWDDGQSCCEHRWLTCDDDLPYFEDSELLELDLSEGPTNHGEYGDEHETMFLKVKTSKGVFTVTTHNEHNGYYGGFWMVVRPMKGE